MRESKMPIASRTARGFVEDARFVSGRLGLDSVWFDGEVCNRSCPLSPERRGTQWALRNRATCAEWLANRYNARQNRTAGVYCFAFLENLANFEKWIVE